MLSDEERKAIEMIEYIQECNTLIGYGVEDRTILAKALLNLIEKQSKEIEELKEKNNKLMEELDLTTVYISGVYDGEKKVEDKIKAKIEVLDKAIKVNRNSAKNSDRVTVRLINDKINELYKAKEVLQSLLEKE